MFLNQIIIIENPGGNTLQQNAFKLLRNLHIYNNLPTIASFDS